MQRELPRFAVPAENCAAALHPASRDVPQPQTHDEDITFALSDLPPRAQLEPQWRELEARADGSFFTSWSWIEAWLTTTVDRAEAAHCSLVSGYARGRVVALAILCRAQEQHLAGALCRQVLYLHESGPTDS